MFKYRFSKCCKVFGQMNKAKKTSEIVQNIFICHC